MAIRNEAMTIEVRLTVVLIAVLGVTGSSSITFG
jgi:hypothetical protein